DAGRGTRGIAAVDDVLLDVADLGGDEGAAVEAGLELGDDSVPGDVSILLLVDAFANEKDAAQTVALVEPSFDGPCHDRLVPHVLVDLTARLEHRLGKVVEEVVLEVV